MFNRSARTIAIISIIFILVLACTLPGNTAATSIPVVPKAESKPTSALSTKTEAIVPTKESTAKVVSTPTPEPQPPTEKPKPTSIVSGAEKLSFSPGGTSVSVTTNINKGDIKKYLIRANKGQMLMVSSFSPANDVVFDLDGISDGSIIARSVTEWNFWLTATQDYLISVKPGGESSNFTLNVTAPANIVFKAGEISATVSGHIQDHATNRYLARANQGQIMTVTITSPDDEVLLTVYGLDDGVPLVRHVSGASEWTGKLPATQDYVIDAVSVGSETDFSLKVTIK